MLRSELNPYEIDAIADVLISQRDGISGAEDYVHARMELMIEHGEAPGVWLHIADYLHGIALDNAVPPTFH